MGGIYSKTTKPDPAAREIVGSSAYIPVDREIINASDVLYSCKFRNYSSSYGSGTGNYLVSNTFMPDNGEHSWAIYFYPNGKKYATFASFVIQLESKPSNQEDEAHFKFLLVDQSGKGKHGIHIRSGLAHKGCEWEAFLSKEDLEESGYLKDDCIQVCCWISIHKSQQLKEDLNKETASSLIINTESWLRLTQRPLFDEYYRIIDEYFVAIDKIQELMKSGMITDYQSKGINVMDMAMKRLQLEFEGILECSSNKVKNHMHICESSTIYSSSVSTYSYELHDTEFVAHGALSVDQVMNLCSIIARLKSSTGFLDDCIEVYKISRKSVVDATFSRFGIEKCGIMKIWSSDWEGIKLWIRTIDVCFQTIFTRENKYFEQIFGGIESATYDDCFLFIITDAAIQLCNFAETKTTTPATFERLFEVLDLYRALLLILPKIKATFHSSSSVNVYFGAAKIVDLLAELVRQIISVFEDTVLNEQLNTPVPGRIIHPLTTYSMDYVIGMLKYKELLTEIIISKPTISLGISDDDMQFLEVGGQTTLALHLVWILTILKFNLEGKSKQYTDTSMGHLFMIKNVELIIVEIEQSSELLEMIGMDYPTMLRQYVTKKTIAYVDSIRDKALHCLRDGLNHKFRYFNRISNRALKKRFKIFNAMLEDFFRTRSTWLESDLQLQRQLRKLMLEELIPAYESFLVKYRSRVESEKYPEKYIMYLPDDLRMSSIESPKTI